MNRLCQDVVGRTLTYNFQDRPNRTRCGIETIVRHAGFEPSRHALIEPDVELKLGKQRQRNHH